MIQDAVTFSEHAEPKIVTEIDVVYALKKILFKVCKEIYFFENMYTILQQGRIAVHMHFR